MPRSVVVWFFQEWFVKSGPRSLRALLLTQMIALSIYAPGWIKINQKRFPRAKLQKPGEILEIADTVSVFYTEAQKADANAFRRLMEHLRGVDGQHSTVIMVQVENEIGIRGDSRDKGSAANATFNAPVPQDLLDMLKANLEHFTLQTHKNTSWPSVFGQSEQTDELFMAYHYTKYVEQVPAAGRAVYAIPLFTNVWQNFIGDDSDHNFKVTIVAGGGSPGAYPSGGGVPNVLDIWQRFAPSLDFIAPDVYLNEYASSCSKYRHRNQPLFIPEQRRDEYGARRIWSASGTYAALGTSPFAIDTLEPASNPFRKYYGLLAQVSTHVLAAQRTPNSSIGFFFDELLSDGQDTCPPINTSFGD